MSSSRPPRSRPACPRCCGRLRPDLDGDVACWCCGWLGPPTAAGRVCAACQKLVAGRPAQSRYCKACADRRERASMQAARLRWRWRTFTCAPRACPDCAADLSGAPSARQRCQRCSRAHRLAVRRRDETPTAVARNRTRREEARRAAGPRLCVDCDLPVAVGRGRPPLRCQACRATNKVVSPEAPGAPAGPADLRRFEPSRISSPPYPYPFLW